MTLPLNDQTLSYNGFSFTSFHKSEVHLRPVYDQANRSVACSRLELNVTAWVNASDQNNLETSLANMSRMLQQPGGVLRYTGKGIRIVINAADGVKDVRWGPLPQSFDVLVIGAGLTVMVQWSCHAHIVMTCTNHVGELLAFNTEVSFDVDVDGLTTRRVSGYIEVPMTRKAAGNRLVPDSADRHWDRILEPIPVGYRREDRHRSLSNDRRTLTFSYTDKQLPHAKGVHLPEGATQAQASHNLNATLFKSGAITGGFRNWQGEFTATLVIPPGRSKAEALFAFFVLVAKVLKIGINLIPAQGVRQMIVLGISLGDDVFGLSARFTIQYAIANAEMGAAVLASGIFQPIPGTSYAAWSRSVADAQSPRGMSQLVYDPSKDIIVDLCHVDAPRGQLNNQPIPGNRLVNAPLGQSVIRPENSWLYYACKLTMKEDNLVVRHVPLGARVTSTVKTDAMANISRDTSGTKLNLDKGDNPNILQTTGSTPACTLFLEGMAIRIGYAAPFPELKNVPGCNIERMGGIRTRYIHSYLFGIPIWVTRWKIPYAADKPPSSFPAPGDPSLGMPGLDQNTTTPIPPTTNINVLRPR